MTKLTFELHFETLFTSVNYAFFGFYCRMVSFWNQAPYDILIFYLCSAGASSFE